MRDENSTLSTAGDKPANKIVYVTDNANRSNSTHYHDGTEPAVVRANACRTRPLDVSYGSDSRIRCPLARLKHELVLRRGDFR